MSSLPPPGTDALAHSARLAETIRAEIENAGGWIPFARYMELALYAPGLGYYSSGSAKFGDHDKGGDFVTAPEISPLFSRCLARQAAQVLTATQGDVLELGAGSGKLALGMLRELERVERLPQRYGILEVSADLRERQRELLERYAPHLIDRVSWLDAMPAKFSGLILGNEVLDALPVHLVAWREDGIHERGVALKAGHFVWQERRLQIGALLDTARSLDLPPGYVSEINLAAHRLTAALADALEHGVLLWIDYGFGRNEYYHPQRSRGTLMCHYRHRAHDDPFHLPGLQDITSHVDFSAVTETGIEHGLRLAGYTTQASFLINCGITELLAKTSPDDIAAYLPQTAQAQKLLSPAEMGELFKVLALGKNMTAPLLGFASGDKSRLL
ncbi:MAG: SAM-dependent methyltransferase [Pseudomonadota bacterium]